MSSLLRRETMGGRTSPVDPAFVITSLSSSTYVLFDLFCSGATCVLLGTSRLVNQTRFVALRQFEMLGENRTFQ